MRAVTLFLGVDHLAQVTRTAQLTSLPSASWRSSATRRVASMVAQVGAHHLRRGMANTIWLRRTG